MEPSRIEGRTMLEECRAPRTTSRPERNRGARVRHASTASLWLLVALLAATSSGCASIRRFAVNKIGDTLASGGSTYESDDDLELVGEALPFGLKLTEGLLAESPKHRGLLQMACQGFTTYAYVYVQPDVDRVGEEDVERAMQIRMRVRRLYLRAYRYGVRGLEVNLPGVGAALVEDPGKALAEATAEDTPLLYWTAASLGLAVSAAKDDAAMLARLPEVEALLKRGLELAEDWKGGAFHELAVVVAGARPGTPNYEATERHYQRALDLSGGTQASLFVAYAEAVAVRRQDRAGFRALLDKALAIDPDAHEEIRLANLVAQRRARWLLDHTDDLFLDAAVAPAGDKP
jgi:predicted anti-sigma-YlaC factor YlaD